MSWHQICSALLGCAFMSFECPSACSYLTSTALVSGSLLMLCSVFDAACSGFGASVGLNAWECRGARSVLSARSALSCGFCTVHLLGLVCGRNRRCSVGDVWWEVRLVAGEASSVGCGPRHDGWCCDCRSKQDGRRRNAHK